MKARLEQDLRLAMKARDELRRDTLRLALAAVKYEEVAQRRPLDDAAIEAVLRRQTKMRRESIEAFGKGGRQELVAKEQAELEILETYLPQKLDELALRAIIERVIAETGATGPKEQGKVMQKLMPELRGRADGAIVAKLVGSLLAQRGQ